MQYDINFVLGIILFVVASMSWVICTSALNMWDNDKMEDLIIKGHPLEKEVDGWHLQEKLINYTRDMVRIITIPLLVIQIVTITCVDLLMSSPEPLLSWQVRLFVISGFLMFGFVRYGFVSRVNLIQGRCRYIRTEIAREIKYLESVEKGKSFVK